MHSMFRQQSQEKSPNNLDIPNDFKERFQLFLTEAFPNLIGDVQLSPESLNEIKSSLTNVFLMACQQAREKISIDVIRDKLIRKEYNESIFSDTPCVTPEIQFLLENDNRSFVQYLFVHCTRKETLDFWLANDRASIPTDGLAIAIRLRSNLCVFERLNSDGFFVNISPQVKDELRAHSSAFLKSRPDSLAFMNDILDRYQRSDKPSHGL